MVVIGLTGFQDGWMSVSELEWGGGAGWVALPSVGVNKHEPPDWSGVQATVCVYPCPLFSVTKAAQWWITDRYRWRKMMNYDVICNSPSLPSLSYSQLGYTCMHTAGSFFLIHSDSRHLNKAPWSRMTHPAWFVWLLQVCQAIVCQQLLSPPVHSLSSQTLHSASP